MSSSSILGDEQANAEQVWETLDSKILHHMTSDEMMTSALATADETTRPVDDLHDV